MNEVSAKHFSGIAWNSICFIFRYFTSQSAMSTIDTRENVISVFRHSYHSTIVRRGRRNSLTRYSLEFSPHNNRNNFEPFVRAGVDRHKRKPLQTSARHRMVLHGHTDQRALRRDASRMRAESIAVSKSAHRKSCDSHVINNI